jgi:4-hydroxybenzoate polyprenyltransferase
VSYSYLLRQEWQPETMADTVSLSIFKLVSAWLIASIVLLLLMWQWQVTQEVVEQETNRQYAPHLPVQQGILSLRDLGIGAIAAGAVQLGLSLTLTPWLLVPLGLVWSYLGVLCGNSWLQSRMELHPLVHDLVNSLVLPFLGLYATGCDWLPAGGGIPPGLPWFLLVNLLTGLAIAISQRMRSPKDEPAHNRTYTRRWGRQKAVMLWLGIVWLLTLSSMLAALYIRFLPLVAMVLLVWLTATVLIAWRFTVRPTSTWANRLEQVSTGGAIAIYLALGIVPWLSQF